MNICLLVKKDRSDIKGEFLSAHNRLKFLKLENPAFVFHPYLISEYDSFILRILKRSHKPELEKYFFYDGISYERIWIKSSILDRVFSIIKLDRYILLYRLRRCAHAIKKSDLIISHSFYSGYLANYMSEKYKIPFSITWHGSDIHSNPFNNRFVFSNTKKIIESANINFFVSKKLLSTSQKITCKGVKYVLYNGVDTSKFYKISLEEKNKIKNQLGVSSLYNIAFIGNLYPVKNADLLPAIYCKVKQKLLDIEISFHIIGDGFLRGEIESKCQKMNVNVKFWGNVVPQKIPLLIHCMDLIILPSKNEGLPLVTLETLSCGVPIVGSNVGGIAESIGLDNVVNLDSDFLENFSNLICEKIQNKGTKLVVLDDKFSWKRSAEIENRLIKELIKNEA